MRAAMGTAAVEAARAVGYVGAGTIEFIADGREGLRPDRFYFMEMNTRLQVEHPVTEAITGLDLVELQFRVAAGERLPFTQNDLAIGGHAVEARLYAEDPETDFLPSTGKLWALEFPEGEGIRIDTGVEAGDEVTPFYDPMIAKVVAHGATRDQALDRLARALGDTVVAGPKTNVAFLKKLCEAQGFRSRDFDTGFIDRNLTELGAVPSPVAPAVAAAGALYLLRREDERTVLAAAQWTPAENPWLASDGFQLLGRRETGLAITVEGESQTLPVAWDAEGPASVMAPVGDRELTIVEAGDDVIVLDRGRQARISLHDPFAVDLEHMGEGGTVKAPMHGKLVALFVSAGERVHKGQRLAVVEAMKMEHALFAPADGEVTEVAFEVGAQVPEGARLIALRANSE
jgi:3-methylcrotonyl-CoA carboxylase alpha subunit